jgi:hypothetical protein
VKRISWLLVLLATAIAGGPTDPSMLAAGSGGFGALILEPAVSDNLALLFGQFDTELVLCLEGEHRGSDLYVTDFRMPHIYMSESGRVQAASCRPGPRSIGTWHNHPAPNLRMASTNPDYLARNCYLSRTDISDFRRRTDALVTVVSCAPHTYAFWRRGDVEQLTEEVVLLPPPDGQLVQSEIAIGARLHDLTKARSR